MRWIPASGSSSVASRFGHSATSVDARPVWGTELLVVFGGVIQPPRSEATSGPHAGDPQAVNEVHALSVESDYWFQPRVTGSVPDPRAFHAAAAVGRQIYVFGGHVMKSEPEGAAHARPKRAFFSDVHVLDTDSWEWSKIWSLEPGGQDGPCRRDMASFVHVGGSHLLLFGGRNEAGRCMGDAWTFDMDLRSWAQLKPPPPVPLGRKMHACVFLGGGRALVHGGEKDVGALDELWSLKGLDGSEPLRWTQVRGSVHQSTVAGGPGEEPPGRLLTHCARACELYPSFLPLLLHLPRPQIKLRPCPPPRFGHALALCGGGRLVAFGGCLESSAFLALTRSYVQTNETWVLDLASFR